MMLPEKSFDWQSLWADLLQGVGAGLLHNDGSRLARSALAGLDAFDLSRERRERRKSQASEHEEPGSRILSILQNLSPAELAAFSRLSPEDQHAFEEEAAGIGLQNGLSAEGQPGIGESHRSTPLPMRREPLSPNPLEQWWRTRSLPFGSDGRLNLPAWRR